MKAEKVSKLEDYDGFVEKFKPKKTTDDCYTPEEVYGIIIDYVRNICDIEGRKIVRPFYPGGDYENFEYPAGCVVIDNPPFSLFSKIIGFYLDRFIDFFLFGPHLTLFSSGHQDYTAIVCGADIEYENGAIIKTSFATNMLGSLKVVNSPDLYVKLMSIRESKKSNLPKYEYPNNVLTVSSVWALTTKGIPFKVDRRDTAFCRSLDSQRPHKKTIFGAGYLLSEKAAAEKAAAERAAAEKAAAEKENVIIWELSEREKMIIDKLG